MSNGPDSWLQRIFDPDEPTRNPTAGDDQAPDDHGAAQALAYALAALVDDSRRVFGALDVLSALAARSQASDARLAGVRRAVERAAAHYEHACHTARDPLPPADAASPESP